MFGLNQVLLRALVAAGAVFSGGLLVADSKIADATPDKLVQAALRAELYGSSSDRAALLDAALARDADCASARWQSGYVRFGHEWLAIEQVVGRAAADERLIAYRKQRDALGDTAADHRKLARWCKKNDLVAESRIHWTRVLEFDSDDSEAISALGLQSYAGRWLTRAQIEQEKSQQRQRDRAFKYWRPQLAVIRRGIESVNPVHREAARVKLMAIDDPDAIPALEDVFAEDEDSHSSYRLNLALIETVSRMRYPEATQVLLRRAIQPESADVRAAAADELKKRPMYAYVPRLISAWPDTVKTRFRIVIAPNGFIVHQHEVYLEGPNSDLAMTYESVAESITSRASRQITPAILSREWNLARAIETSAQEMERKNSITRERVRFALARATGFTRVDDLALWRQQYNEYYDRSEGEGPKPVERQYAWNYERYVPPPEPSAFVGGRAVLTVAGECFAAGTPVVTITGSVSIERLKMGDRVLAQNPRTGELDYQQVQRTTVRPTVPMVELAVGAETIHTTRGHPFWVGGRGWVIASQLRAGDYLHSTSGPVRVDRVGDSPAAEAYNLVVSEFATYFVGRQRLLVHDNLPLEETPTVLPGLASSDP